MENTVVIYSIFFYKNSSYKLYYSYISPFRRIKLAREWESTTEILSIPPDLC